jgi:hypothetical protein
VSCYPENSFEFFMIFVIFNVSQWWTIYWCALSNISRPITYNMWEGNIYKDQKDIFIGLVRSLRFINKDLHG